MKESRWNGPSAGARVVTPSEPPLPTSSAERCGEGPGGFARLPGHGQLSPRTGGRGLANPPGPSPGLSPYEPGEGKGGLGVTTLRKKALKPL
jgi:hypothetical protein